MQGRPVRQADLDAAAVAWIRAVAGQRSIPLGALCERLHTRPDTDRTGR
jgi:hypothetical protein